MITYKKGNLLNSTCNIICHQVNCQGVMSAGIAKQIRDRFPLCYENYREFVKRNGKEKCLGDVYFYQAWNDTIIANMFSQFHYLPRGMRHTDYDAFRSCCGYIKQFLNFDNFNSYDHVRQIRIGFPYGIGCGLGGGDWEVIKGIIEEEFSGDMWNVEIWKYEGK